MRRTNLVVALGIVVTLASACVTDPVPAGSELVGEYNLKTIDGNPLPYSYVDGGKPVTIVSRQLLVMKNGPFPTAYWTDSSLGTIVVDGVTRPRSAQGVLTFVSTGDTLVLTSTESAVKNIPSFSQFIQDHQGGLRRLGPFAAELYHR